MPETKEQDTFVQNPQLAAVRPPFQPQKAKKPRVSFNKLMLSTYFRIGLTFFLLILLFLTASFIAFQSEQKRKKLKDYEKQIPKAEIIIPVTEEVSTENRGTYTDNQFNFQIIYPNTMSVRKINKRDELLIGGASANLIYNDNEFRSQASEIYVSVYKSGGLTLEDWLSQNSTVQPFGSDTENEFYSFTKLDMSLLDNIEGIKFGGETFGFKEVNVAAKNGDHIYVVGYVEVADDLSLYYDQILSTFKFLE